MKTSSLNEVEAKKASSGQLLKARRHDGATITEADTIEFAGVFAHFRLYVGKRRLYRLDPGLGEVRVRVGTPGLSMLRLLVEREWQQVSKMELKCDAWGDAKAKNGSRNDDHLRVEIANLRAALGEEAGNSCIRTLPGGYVYEPPSLHLNGDDGHDDAAHPFPPPDLTAAIAAIKAATKRLEDAHRAAAKNQRSPEPNRG
jgi:DNA-binding winged helix-turn-helix (wHTH) protein